MLLIAALSAAPHLGTLRAQFLNWDDDRFVTQNPLFAGSPFEYAWAAISRVQFQAYQPLHLLSYLPDRLLWPRAPLGFHALNVLLFAVAVALLYRLLCRVGAAGPALLATLLFAWHPLLVEPVAWITARKDLLALNLVVLVLHSEDRAAEGDRSRLRSFLLTVAAVLAKSSAMVLPLFVFAWHRWVRRQPRFAALHRALPLLAVSLGAAALVTTLWTQANLIERSRPLPAVLDVSGTFGVYLSHLVWPHNLSPLYPALMDGQKVAAWGFLLGAAVFAGALVRGRLPPAACFAVLCTLGALAPFANALPLYFRFADRYALFALLGLTWPVANALTPFSRVGRPHPFAYVVAAVVLASEATAAYRTSGAWRDSVTLWTHATEAQPRSFYAWLKLGETLRTTQSWDPAAHAYLQGIEVDPRSALGFGGLFLTIAGRSEAAGRLPAGTARRWLAQLESGTHDAEALDRLIVTTRAEGCAPCSAVVLWLSLRSNPLPDEQLLRAANEALAHDLPDAAAVMLEEVRAQDAPDVARLRTVVQRRLREGLSNTTAPAELSPP